MVATASRSDPRFPLCFKERRGDAVVTSSAEIRGRVTQVLTRRFSSTRWTLWVTFEEGTSAAWLYDLLKPYVAKVVVCDPRKNALLKAGNKNDRIDARKLADLLRAGLLSPVYHGESGVRLLKELARSTWRSPKT
jgi:transposase